jgi:AcrR family transcriptional regulator
MRSAGDVDLTTRARIRDAAIARFGRDGVAATSVRAIAGDAGVSPALVIHHFGSKDRLRQACDEHIVEQLVGRADELDHTHDAAGTMQRWLSDTDHHRAQLDYLARMFGDGTELGDELFERVLDGTKRILATGVANGTMLPADDEEARAVVITANGMATLFLARQIGRALGDGNGLDSATIRRLTLPTLDLYTRGLYADDTVLSAARDALGRSAVPRDDKGDGHPNQDPDPPVRR